MYTKTPDEGARALKKERVYRRAGFAFTNFLPAVGTLARKVREPRARRTALGASMLKNALIFAAAALVLAFAAPSLLPERVAAPAAPKPDAPARAVPVSSGADSPGDSGFREASIAADAVGQFHANALIEGQEVEVMVDTGATMVALSADTAARLGVVIDPAAPKLRTHTANGDSFVSPVVLKQVSLGSIYMNDVQAWIMAPGAGTANLLGASFLKRLAAVEQRDGMLVLKQ